MTNESIVLATIALFSGISILFLIYALLIRSARLIICGGIMLLCPLVGHFFFLGAFVAEKIGSRSRKMQIEDIGFSKEKRGRLLAPDDEEESQSVPLEEIFLVSQDHDKRRYLLRELKKGEIENYSTLVKALDNDDLETAHYAASTLSNAKTEFENNLRGLDSLYSQAGGAQDLELVRKYADYLLRFLKSGILGETEMRYYSYNFIEIMTRVENPDEFLTVSDYANVINELIRLGEYGRAEEWAKKALYAGESEEAYLSLAKVYYYTGRQDKLNDVIERMKKSDITLSGGGLDLVRFFMRRTSVKQPAG